MAIGLCGKAWLVFLLSLICFCHPAAAYSPPSQPDTAGEAEGLGIPQAVVALGVAKPFHVLLVDKSQQRLYLYRYGSDGETKFIRAFRCSTGKKAGDKVAEGDRRTPEGIYFFTKVYRDSKLTIFGRTAYHLNYPDLLDQAEERHGNGIYLHGTNRPLGERATNGCVVMENADLDFLSEHVELYDTAIVISRRLGWSKPEELERDREILTEHVRKLNGELAGLSGAKLPPGAKADLKRVVLFREGARTLVRVPIMNNGGLRGWSTLYLNSYPGQVQVVARAWQPLGGLAPSPGRPMRAGRNQVLDFLQEWVRAWESRDVDRYMAFYSNGFKAYGMNHGQWRAYKTKLAQKYKAIDVQISGIVVKTRGNRAEASFVQSYVSDQFQDYGRKTLTLRLEGGRWKIWRENWYPAQTMEARR